MIIGLMTVVIMTKCVIKSIYESVYIDTKIINRIDYLSDIL